ncbi:hypothetical protein JCM10207_001208 [Rhodosporidiobolus poonsookiae]
MTGKAASAGSKGTGGSGEGRKATKRATLSCSECRRLKLKCDRQVPCGSCVKRGLSSLCPDGQLAPTRTSKMAASTSALAERVELLESILRQNGLGHTVPVMAAAATAGIEMAAKRREAAAKGVGGSEGRAEGSEVEALGAGVGSLTMRDDGSYRFLGTSAGLAYGGDSDAGESSEEGYETTDSRQSPTSGSKDLLGFPFRSKVSLKAIRGELPAEEEARRLSAIYWDSCSFLLCPMEASDYWEDYLPSSFSAEPNGSKLACVFMVIALGSQFDPAVPAAANAAASRYYSLGQAALAASRFLSHSTLAGVQALHLCVNLHFSRHKVQDGGESFFPLLGMAVKMGQTMGLHRDPQLWGLDEKETQRRRLAFWELFTLDHLQAFVSGRPYSIHHEHFDTAMPASANEVQKEKWRLCLFSGEIFDGVFSVRPPTQAVIHSLDERLRKLFEESHPDSRCPAMPPSAFSSPGTVPPPTSLATVEQAGSLHRALAQHSLALLYSVFLLYLHKFPFAQALEHYPDDPLQSPWAASVNIVILEAAAYILNLARSWMQLDPVVCPRWWHPSFHLFVAGVAQASLIIRSPRCSLVTHAWQQLSDIETTFESAAQTGAPIVHLLPRIQALRQKAYSALATAQMTADGRPVSRDAANLAAPYLGTTTQLSRTKRMNSADTTQDEEGKAGQADEPSSAAMNAAASLANLPRSGPHVEPYSTQDPPQQFSPYLTLPHPATAAGYPPFDPRFPPSYPPSAGHFPSSYPPHHPYSSGPPSDGRPSSSSAYSSAPPLPYAFHPAEGGSMPHFPPPPAPGVPDFAAFGVLPDPHRPPPSHESFASQFRMLSQAGGGAGGAGGPEQAGDLGGWSGFALGGGRAPAPFSPEQGATGVGGDWVWWTEMSGREGQPPSGP